MQQKIGDSLNINKSNFLGSSLRNQKLLTTFTFGFRGSNYAILLREREDQVTKASYRRAGIKASLEILPEKTRNSPFLRLILVDERDWLFCYFFG
jgi:hypothetical protein